jgi:drug/metabolite transporter (DMT)-like permease
MNGLAAWAARLPRGAVGVACGTAAALCWAFGLVSARHGIAIGLSPLDLTFHRLVWPGLAFLAFAGHWGIAGVAELGWGRSIILTACGGILVALLSNAGFLLVPLGHGGVIQPSSAALGGLLLVTLVLKEKLLPARAAGALAILCGLCVIGFEALSTFGAGGLLGDLSFAAAGFSFAVFGILLKLWRVMPIRAVAITSILSLVMIPLQLFVFGFDRIIAAGWHENLVLAVVQGGLSGAAAIYLFTRAVVLLGAGRAAVFPALVPPFTLLVGFVVAGIMPTAPQLVGLVIVLVGFRLTQKS